MRRGAHSHRSVGLTRTRRREGRNEEGRANLEQLSGPQRVGHHDRDTHRLGAGRELLHHQGVAVGGEALPTVLLVNDHAQEPVLADEIPDRLRQVLEREGEGGREAGREEGKDGEGRFVFFVLNGKEECRGGKRKQGRRERGREGGTYVPCSCTFHTR